MTEIIVEIVRLPNGAGLDLPAYQTPHAAGMDLFAAEEKVILPGERELVATGISVAIPEGFEAQIRPRSGLAIKFGVTLLNTPGTIDADYRGEIKVIMINHGREEFRIERGDRVAQMIFAPVTRGVLVEVKGLSETVRGEGGFGSTGSK